MVAATAATNSCLLSLSSVRPTEDGKRLQRHRRANMKHMSGEAEERWETSNVMVLSAAAASPNNKEAAEGFITAILSVSRAG